MTRKKNKNKLSSPTTTKKTWLHPCLCFWMKIKQTKTNFTFAIWIFKAENYTTKFVCSLSCPSSLQFAINTCKAQHSQQWTRAGRRNAQGQQKIIIISPWNHYYYFLWALSSCKAYWKHVLSQQHVPPPRNNGCFS